MLEVQRMGCKMVVFHQLFADYILAVWELVRSDMAGYLVLLYFLAYSPLKVRNNYNYFDTDTVVAAD